MNVRVRREDLEQLLRLERYEEKYQSKYFLLPLERLYIALDMREGRQSISVGLLGIQYWQKNMQETPPPLSISSKSDLHEAENPEELIQAHGR